MTRYLRFVWRALRVYTTVQDSGFVTAARERIVESVLPTMTGCAEDARSFWRDAKMTDDPRWLVDCVSCGSDYQPVRLDFRAHFDGEVEILRCDRCNATVREAWIYKMKNGVKTR